MTSRDLKFHKCNSQISQPEEIKKVDSSVSFTLVFIDEEIKVCGE